MRSIDLKDLVIGLLTVIVLAASLGQFSRLQEFAKRQAIEALKPWPAHPFFPVGYDGGSHRH